MTRFKSLALRLELRRANRQLRVLHQAHIEAYHAHQALVRAREAGDHVVKAEERSQQTAEVSVAKVREVEGLEARIRQIRQARLNRKLVRRGLDLPDSEWYYTVYAPTPNGGSIAVSTLSKYGESKVRRALRADSREAWEFRFKVITPVLTGLTGLIGVIIGLVSSERVVPAFQRLLHWLFGW